MRVQPRQQLLEIWRATALSSYQDGKWISGGRELADSISDAEQLLCLMIPATSVGDFGLDRLDSAADDVLRALHSLGNSFEIPRLIIRVITEYLDRYTDGDGTPVFSGDSYLAAAVPEAVPTRRQRDLDVVESFAMSITLMLATIAFVRALKPAVSRDETLQEIATLEAKASTRLTAAMIGLLRSFAVHAFDADSADGQALIRMVNQERLPQRRIVADLRRALQGVSAGVRNLTAGWDTGSDVANPDRLFECGWSWGIVRDAPPEETAEDVGTQRQGLAPALPYLHFTVTALDAIEALFSQRTIVLRLLNDEQQRLARRLELRWSLTQSYWSTIATFGNGPQWPLEDIPWQTTDEVESDYFSLLVTSVVVQNVVRRHAPDADLKRVAEVLYELAGRSRITRRAMVDDSSISVHAPGVRFELYGSEDAGGPRLAWTMSDFAPLLLKRTVSIAGLLQDVDARERLLGLADKVWDHLDSRRLKDGVARGLWDQPADAFPRHVQVRYDSPSWRYTERVVECLVTAAHLVERKPLRSDRLREFAMNLLSEAEHLFDHERLRWSTDVGPAMREELRRVEANLHQARANLAERPGTSVALASEALRQLNALRSARDLPS